MAQGDPNNSVIPRSGLDGKPLSPPSEGASAFDKSQYEKAVFDAQMLAQTRADLKEMWRQRSLDKLKDMQNSREFAEAAFDSMVSSCANSGQVAKLMNIKDEWIRDAATGPIISFDQYMSKWKQRIG